MSFPLFHSNFTPTVSAQSNLDSYRHLSGKADETRSLLNSDTETSPSPIPEDQQEQPEELPYAIRGEGNGRAHFKETSNGVELHELNAGNGITSESTY